MTSNEDAVVISWLPPRRPNGILTKYTVHIRVLDQGQEVKTIKSSLPAQNLHHEATGLKQRESYEAWVTASTKIGQGPRTPVIKLQLSNTGKSSSLGQTFLGERKTFSSPLPLLFLFLPYPRYSLPEESISNGSIRQRSRGERAGKLGQ